MTKSKYASSFLKIAGASFLALSLAACGTTDSSKSDDKKSSETTKETRTLTDAMGNKVEVPVNPKRVLASYLEDNLVALDITPVAQWSVNDGASIQDYLQDSLKDVPTVNYDLPLESVQELKPDLIIMDSASMVEGDKYAQYKKIAPTYVIGKDLNNDWRDELLRVGEVFDKKDEAQAKLDEYDAKSKEAATTIKEDYNSPSAAGIWIVGGKAYIVAEELSAGAVMYGDLGMKVPDLVKEVSAKTETNWNEISLEKLASLDADHLFVLNSDGDNDKITTSKIWKAIPAVKADQVHTFDPTSSWLYTGTVANTQIIDDVLESLKK
ncbi:MAG: ABC transporter substrate-binding protein [Kurthia sp.]|nr:ABC transporter substrate-binding protein [Candidatus Kurthia equi]